MARHELRGVIASTGFASGDRVVVGHWHASPVGPMTDVMWARPDGTRVLLAPNEVIAAFVTAVYRFDRVEIVPFAVGAAPRVLDVVAGGLEIRLVAGRGWPIPIPRPPWVTRRLEAPLARLLGVRAYGESPSGVREWYRADWYRAVRHGRGALEGVDLGALRPVDPPLGVGFSEPPRRPAIVAVRPLLEDPSGRLDAVLQRL